jgi:hypothetical protein
MIGMLLQEKRSENLRKRLAPAVGHSEFFQGSAGRAGVVKFIFDTVRKV